MGLINYSYFPFLSGARRPIEQIEEQAIIYAKNNIEKYSPTNILELDISVFLTSTIILRNIDNNFLTRKFVSNFGKFFESRMLKDIQNKEIRMEILDYFGVVKDLEYISVREQRLIKIHLLDYLEIQNNSFGAPNLSLVNQTLERGFVIIEVSRFIYLLRLAFEHRLYDKIKSMEEYTKIESINRCVKELQIKYPKFDKQQQAPDKTNIPESIKSLIDKAYREHHLDHNERIRLGIYLQKYNYDMDYILDIFKALSDWNEKVTRYQLNSLKRYIK